MRSRFSSSPVRGRVLGALAAVVLLIGPTTPSRAELMSTVDTGSLEQVVNTLDPFGSVLAAPVAATVTRDGSNLLTHVDFASSIFNLVGFVVPVTDPAAAPIGGLAATVRNKAPDFNRAPPTVNDPDGKIGGLMPLSGVNKVCLFATCGGAAANLNVPVSIVGGPAGGFAFVSGAVNLTVVGAPWTQGTAAIGTVTRMGNANNTMTQEVGTMGTITNDIQLVTPVFVSTNIPASAVVPVWGLLNFTIKSVPEPGTIAAFGAAFIGLISVGMARRR